MVNHSSLVSQRGFVLLISPFFMIVKKKVKAQIQGREGPHIIQGYYNLAKLFQKEVNIFRVCRIYLSDSSVCCSLNHVSFSSAGPAFWIPEEELVTSHIIVFLYLLVAGRLLIALLGLDAASTFGGMASSREMSLSAILEPVTVIVFATLVYVMGSFSIHEIFKTALTTFTSCSPTVLLLSVPLFILIIVETGRILWTILKTILN
jgi:formate hydrogenlyase subunit 4